MKDEMQEELKYVKTTSKINISFKTLYLLNALNPNKTKAKKGAIM